MKPSDPRRAALDVLNALDAGPDTLDRLLDDRQHRHADFDPRDRRLFNALTYGVLRWRGRLDWIIGSYSRVRPDKIEPNVRNILRLALFQIVFLDKIPVSAAVNTAVELAKSSAASWTVRYVNGVLRNAARGWRTLTFPAADTDPAAAISVRFSFPEWLVRRWLPRFGPTGTGDLCRAVNTVPPVTLRTNTLKTSRDDLVAAVADLAETVTRTRYAPWGVEMVGLRTPLAEMPVFRKGWLQVQDEAAQLVALVLDPQPGERVLDACAGLGGKTGHIAQLMNDRGEIVALDKSRHRLSALEIDRNRLGLSSVTVCRADLAASPLKLPGPRFDRILLDAPCSGLGVLRRNPDAKWRTDRKQPAVFARRQLGFLENLSGHLKPGGIMVFAVCSMEPEENEAVVKVFLNNHPDFAMETPGMRHVSGADEILDENGFLRTFPHRHHMDGFFAARLRRVG